MTPILCAALALLLAAGRATAQYSITIESNVVYGVGAINAHSSSGTKNLLADVYRPVGAAGLRPTLLLIHGGSFTSGSRDSLDMLDAATFFTTQGWACVSIDYRLVADDPPAPIWVEALGSPIANTIHAANVDSKRAVRWIRAHSAEYGFDTNRLAALGHSAGAYCIVQSLISAETEYANDAGSALPDQWMGYRGQPNAGVDVSGGQVSTGSSFDPTDPPIMIWHGDADTVVPYAEAQAIDQECLDHQIPHRFFTLSGKDHGYDTWVATYNGRGLKEHALEFLNLFFFLQVELYARDGGLVLAWPSVSNSLYDIESSTDLGTAFTNMATSYRSFGDTTSTNITSVDPLRFYRLRVRSGQF